MRKLVFILILFSIWLITPHFAYADVAIPGWDQKTCQAGETKFVCDYTSTTPFGPKIYSNSDCELYSKNPDYYLLTGRGSSFGGEEWYCLKTGKLSKSISPSSPAKFTISANLLTVVSVIIVASASILLLGRLRNGGIR